MGDSRHIRRQHIALLMPRIHNKWILALSVVLIDQAAKFSVLKYFGSHVLKNPNLALNLRISFLEPKYISLATLLVIIVLAIIFWNKISQPSALLVVAGSFSNLIDRFWSGGVIDFINPKIWPSFNIADLAITVGLVLLCINFFRISQARRFS